MTDEEICRRFLEGETPHIIATALCKIPGEGMPEDLAQARVLVTLRHRLQALGDELRIVYEGTVDMRGTV